MKKPLYSTLYLSTQKDQKNREDREDREDQTPRISSEEDFSPMLKYILKGMVSPVNNPKARDNPPKMRQLEMKSASGLSGKLVYGKTIKLWQVEDLKIPSNFQNNLSNDKPLEDLTLRIYTPKKTEQQPGIIFYHGGGYVVGSLTVYDKLCRKLARDLDAIVVSVDYRLAPEFKFPQALKDAWSALQWCFAHNHQLHIDSKRMFVMGDSAGGGLAAIMAQKARDTQNIKIAGQILVYPWVDGNLTYPSMQKFASGFGLSKQEMEYFQKCYMNSPDDLADPQFSPLLHENLSNLPPTFIITASHDPLRDQGIAYAQKLTAAGNQLIFKNYQPTIHGFLSVFNILPRGKEYYQDVINTIQSMMDSGSK